ncbi:MAG: type I-C CRISPR-associated protein Cas5c [Candidatus Pacebacteria bacterium]|nr:type I-C CRISPR-associated protein Cas5c [Candidatus Paceibacterota bacterium]
MTWSPLEVVLWGDYACFTRPEMKVERVSYPIMTPSAARGALEAIYRKPEFHWQISEIQALKPLRWFSIKRNEVSNKINYTTVKGWKNPGDGYYADVDRTQRASLLLQDVKFLVKADIVLKPHADKDIAAYRAQFRRRVAKGACFYRPYLGCREFWADFTKPTAEDIPCDWSEDLGRILFDIDFDPPDLTENRKCPGSGTPVFFHAKVNHGVMKIPVEKYAELRWASGEEVWR